MGGGSGFQFLQNVHRFPFFSFRLFIISYESERDTSKFEMFINNEMKKIVYDSEKRGENKAKIRFSRFFQDRQK